MVAIQIHGHNSDAKQVGTHSLARWHARGCWFLCPGSEEKLGSVATREVTECKSCQTTTSMVEKPTRFTSQSRHMKTKRGQTVPVDIARAVRGKKTALAGFQSMPPSYQHEYLDYIQEGKKLETQSQRIQKSITMMAKWYRDRPKKHQ